MAEDKAPQDEPPKKGKFKLILLVVTGVILAVVLSILGTLWFLEGEIPGLSTEAEAEGETEEVFVPSQYVVLDKALVTTVQAENRQRYAQVFLALEAKERKALEAAQLHMPLLRSRLISALGRSEFASLQTPEGRQALAERMLAEVNQVMEQEGEPPLERVLFRNFVVQ